LLTVALAGSPALAQTAVKRDTNRYTPEQDVEIGLQASEEVRRELPMLNDARVDQYVERVGRSLVRAIPPEFQEAVFRYTFDVVNQKEINAFALPGGPMFLHRGMIEAAKAEGEMAGVMAHEIAHVALRHGTARRPRDRNSKLAPSRGRSLARSSAGPPGV
jgi:predicted Zn-dependent protease